VDARCLGGNGLRRWFFTHFFAGLLGNRLNSRLLGRGCSGGLLGLLHAVNIRVFLRFDALGQKKCAALKQRRLPLQNGDRLLRFSAGISGHFGRVLGVFGLRGRGYIVPIRAGLPAHFVHQLACFFNDFTQHAHPRFGVARDRVPVFTVRKGQLVESVTDAYGMPNTDDDGILLDSHFPTREQAIAYGIRDLGAWEKMLVESITDIEEKLAEKKARLAKFREDIAALEALKTG